MTTTILTGRDLQLTVDSTVYDSQGSSVVMALTNEQSEFDVLSGTVYKTLKTTGTLTVEMFQDWGAGTSICELLFDLANDADTRDVGITFSFIVGEGAAITTFSGEVFPNFPEAGGASPSELTTSVELKIVEGLVSRV